MVVDLAAPRVAAPRVAVRRVVVRKARILPVGRVVLKDLRGSVALVIVALVIVDPVSVDLVSVDPVSVDPVIADLVIADLDPALAPALDLDLDLDLDLVGPPRRGLLALLCSSMRTRMANWIVTN